MHILFIVAGIIVPIIASIVVIDGKIVGYDLGRLTILWLYVLLIGIVWSYLSM